MQKTNLTVPLPAGLAETAGLLLAPDGVYASDAAAAEAFAATYSGSAAELQWHQQQKLAALAEQYGALVAAGRSYTVPGDASGAHVYQIDEVAPIDPTTGQPSRRSSQDTITSMGAWAVSVLGNVPGTAAWPTGFAWIDANNLAVPMTAAQCYAFSQDIATYVAALKDNYFGLKAAIAGASTAAAVDAINVAAGWPSNP